MNLRSPLMEKTQVMTSVDVQSQFVGQALAEARPVLSNWYTEQTLREHLATEVERYLTSPPEQGVRLLELPGGRRVVAHVPVSAPRPDAWTVVAHRSFAVADAPSLRSTAEDVTAALAPYAPSRLIVFMHGRPLDDAHVADHLVAGLIDELRTPADALPRANLRLIEPASMDFYEEYREWYEEFWRRRPHLRDVRIETREDIEDCLTQGGVRLIYLGDQLCGMMAAQRRIEYGLRGWRMRERVTAPGRWSQGISTAAFVPFAQSLDYDEHDGIWGNILPRNTSSLESALRLGRRIVGTYYEA